MVTTVAALERQLIVVVEGTAAMGPHWKSIIQDYLEKIVRSFFANENSGQKLSEMALVVFNSHGPYSACLVQRSGWIKDIDMFLHYLSTLPFNGGGFNEGAVADGLAEASLMFAATSDGNQSQKIIDCHKHCILVAASNPHPLPTPVPRLHVQNVEKAEIQTEFFLADAETVAKSFAQSPYSLSVISPKQLPKLRAIYNAGKRNPRAPDPTVDHVKSPHSLVLISEHFVEARSALSSPGAASLPLNQGLVKVDGPPAPPVSLGTPVSLPPSTSMPTVNVPMLSRSSASGGNMPASTVKVEPTTLSTQAFSHQPSVSSVASQGISTLPTSSLSPATQEISTNTEPTQEFKPVVNPISTLRSAGPAAANVNILNNLSQARQVINSASIAGGGSMGLPTKGVSPMAMHMSNMISNGMVSSALSGITSISGSGTLAATTQAAQNTAMSSLTSTNSNISGNSSVGISSPLPNPQANIGMGQSLHGIGQTSLNSGSQMGQSGISANQNVMTSLGAPSISSGAGTMIPTPGMSQTPPQPDSLGAANGSNISMPSQQHVPGAQQSQSNYVRIWEGALSGQRAGQPVYICKLEGYRSGTASPKLADDWPDTMQIVRLISQDHMNNKQYVGKADLLVFRPLNQHGFLAQLQDKKLCAVIQLPSQTLLLSVTNRTSRLIGMLFPGDTVVFKPQLSNQQQQQIQQQQQQQVQQHQTQQPQRPQMVGTAMNQSFSQGAGRSQMMSQGMMQQQGNMPGGNFLP